ncbi:MAG: Ig-like domain-containing protein [Terracidiphilus sp.]|jgi:hypothetical protein
MKKLSILAFMLVGGSATLSFAQSTGTVTQTVSQRNTIGVLTASPSTGITSGGTVTFTYILNTAGAPAPTSETVQFYDGINLLGSTQSIGSANGSNLLPYSQVNTGHGWTTSGTAPTVTSLASTGPDGSASTATTISFVDGTSTVQYAVPGTAYASQQVTFSIWAKTATTATLNLTLTDSPYSSATSSSACALTSSWQRCSLTYTFPAGAGTGFAALLTSSSPFATNISVWGAQVEVAAAPGPYVSTIGTARPSVTGGAGTVTWADTTGFADGTHNISVLYAGDTNFVTSTSNTVSLTVGKATPGLSLNASPSGTASYGTPITLTATLSNLDSGSPLYPTGTVTFYNNGTSIGTGTLTQVGSGNTSTYALVLSGSNSLAGGSDSLTVAYGGDSNFTAVTDTSTPVSYTVSPATSGSGGATLTTTVTSSLNPSVYGDTVTLSVNVAGTGAMPTGTVTIADTTTSTILGTPTLDGSGNASIIVTATNFTAGAHSIKVTYSGDGNYSSSY